MKKPKTELFQRPISGFEIILMPSVNMEKGHGILLLHPDDEAIFIKNLKEKTNEN